MTIDYETIITLDLKGKRVLFFLEKGSDFRVDNLVDVAVYEILERWHGVADSHVEWRQREDRKI